MPLFSLFYLKLVLTNTTLRLSPADSIPSCAKINRYPKMIHYIPNISLAWSLLFIKLIISPHFGEACSGSHNVANVGEAILHNLGEKENMIRESMIKYNICLTLFSSGDEGDCEEEYKMTKYYFYL